MELEIISWKNLFDYGIKFWYCKVQEQMNENALIIFQPYGPIDQHFFYCEAQLMNIELRSFDKFLIKCIQGIIIIMDVSKV
jgi:hypothetical protein